MTKPEMPVEVLDVRVATDCDFKLHGLDRNQREVGTS